MTNHGGFFYLEYGQTDLAVLYLTYHTFGRILQMRTVLARLASLFLCIMILLSAFPAAFAAEETPMGYSLLNSKQKYAYDQLLAGISNCSATIKLSKSKNVSTSDLALASKMLLNDHPELFWYSGTFQDKVVNNKYVSEVYPEYKLDGKTVKAGSSELASAHTALASAVDGILGDMTGENEYEKALYLHDALVAKVTYVTGADDQTAYGALVDGKAVCAGYTRAYQYLLQKAGIRSWKIDGTATRSDGTKEEHSWLLMWIDGKCVYTDITWDDSNDRPFHSYFCLPLSVIALDHAAEEPFASALPQCDHEVPDYYALNAKQGSGIAKLTDDAKADAMAPLFAHSVENGKDVFTCYMHYSGNDFAGWVNANAQALVAHFRMVGPYEFSAVNLGREYHLTFVGTVDNTPEPTLPSMDELIDEEAIQNILTIGGIAAGAIVVLVIICIVATKKKK